MTALRTVARLPHRSGASDAEIEAPLPGDELVPDATDVVDRAVTLAAPAGEVWPWLVQLGKGRGGWYFPARLERIIPASRRATRTIEPALQQLTVGEHVPDWGPGQPEFRAVTIDAPTALVYLSLRDRAAGHRWPADDAATRPGVIAFSWALTLTDLGPSRSRLHIRLRMRVAPSRLPLATVGGLFDWLTIRLMFAGLAERLGRGDRVS